MSSDDASLPTVEGFTDFQVIGHGGFSIVYSATQTDFRRRVAVKVLNVDPAAVNRLRRETHALGALDSIPNVVQAYQMLTLADGRLAIVMRLMDTSLATQMSENGRLPFDQVLAWTLHIGAALQAAHDRGIHHRDIKPANVLLSASEAFLADFGIATLADLETSTMTALSLSPLFAPPERLEGGTEDPRSGDIYSFAATIFAAMHGAPPFGTTLDGGIFGLTKRVVSDQLAPSPSIAPPIHAVLARAMAKRPAERYASVDEFVGALMKATNHDTTVRRVHPPTIEVKSPPPSPVDSLSPATELLDATVLTPRLAPKDLPIAGTPPPFIELPPPSIPTEPPPERGRTSPFAPRRIAAAMVGVAVLVISAVGVAVAVGGDDAQLDESATETTNLPSTTNTTDPVSPASTAPPTAEALLAMTPAEQLGVLHTRFPGLGSDCVDAPTTEGILYQPHIICNRNSEGRDYSLFAWGPDPGGGQPFLEAEYAGTFDGGALATFQYEDQGLQGRMWRYDGEAVFMQVLTTQSSEQADALMYEFIEANRPS